MESPDSNRNVAPRVLVVDDEKVIREILADFLSLEGFQVAVAQDGVVALEQLSQNPFDMVISDLKMPNMGGLELLEHIQNDYEDVLTVIMTGFGTVETAIEAMKKGAYDYILKPFKVEEVVHIVQRGFEKQRLISENIRLREIISLHALSEQLQASLSLEEIVDSTLSTCIKNAKIDLVAFYLRNKETQEFEEHNHMTGPNAPVDADIGQLNLPVVLAEVEKRGSILLNKNSIAQCFFSTPKDITSFLCIPMVARQRTLGLLVFHSYAANSAFTEGQRKLTSMLGSRAAAAVDNALLYRNLQLTFRQTIQGLARAIEAMDTYTAGHSDRVTIYSRLIAEELQEPQDQIELIEQASILHDIGKLGCHTNLNKPGKLTKEEYEIFKAHPSFGKDILEPITFLKSIIPGVHHHHERWDGDGYPLKLKGEEIPQIARILSVADSYDAMTSNRAYRRAMEHSVAIQELKRCTNSQFDPTVVDAFLTAIEAYRGDCRKLGIPYPL
jgi:response regulator RpfG family c-di-GMP phosphodiesterase